MSVGMKHGLIPRIRIHPQENTQWCYAAVIQSILEYYTHNSTSQPDIVRNVTGSSANNSPQDPHGDLHRMDLIYDSYDGHPSWETIREQVDARRPIIVRIGANTGHYVIIIGYVLPESSRSRIATGNVVIYIDPMKSTLTYETGPDSNRMVTCAYEGKTRGEAPDEITGYYLTQPLPRKKQSRKQSYGFKIKRKPKFHSIRKRYPPMSKGSKKSKKTQTSVP